MKKRTIHYSEEPVDAGWKFDAKAKPLDAEQRRSIGVSEIDSTGTTYHRVESTKGVRLHAERGGARPGAGRKNKGHVRLQLLVPPTTRAKIERIAAREQISLSEAVSRAIAKA